MTGSDRPSTTVVGVFSDRQTAEEAVNALHAAGFKAGEIGFAGHGEMLEGGDEGEVADAAASGAVGGGMAGGILGALYAGLIPGVGPIIGAGILAATFAGAAAGAVAGGLMGGLTEVEVPEQEAQDFVSEFESGRAIVVVKAAAKHGEARAILRAAGALNLGQS